MAFVTASIAEFLHSSERIQAADLKTFHGFNGLHGGLAVAALVRRMRQLVPADRRLAAVTARFIRPLAGPITVDADIVRTGSTLTITSASASSQAGTGVAATAIFGVLAPRDIPVLAPAMPTGITGLADAEVVHIPAEFIPISQRMEIRAATGELPYSGSADPVLCGWIRLKDDVAEPEERITILVDSLAPSYTALLTELKAVPTVEMSVQISAAATQTAFGWALVRATTTSADTYGYVRESIDLWAEGGEHLASCTQLRVVR